MHIALSRKKNLGASPADIEAAGLEEGEDHATADDELVALAEEALNHTNLGGNLKQEKLR
jgi:hypothetical protein